MCRSRRRIRLRATAVPTDLPIAYATCVRPGVGRNCTLIGPFRTDRPSFRNSAKAVRPRRGSIRRRAASGPSVGAPGAPRARRACACAGGNRASSLSFVCLAETSSSSTSPRARGALAPPEMCASVRRRRGAPCDDIVLPVPEALRSAGHLPVRATGHPRALDAHRPRPGRPPRRLEPRLGRRQAGLATHPREPAARPLHHRRRRPPPARLIPRPGEISTRPEAPSRARRERLVTPSPPLGRPELTGLDEGVENGTLPAPLRSGSRAFPQARSRC
jgi:hypothetical protein